MQPRDVNMDEAHFEEYIERCIKRIDEDLRIRSGEPDLKVMKLMGSSYKQPSPERMDSLLALKYHDLLWAMYSAGYPVEELKPVFSKWVACESRSLPNPVGPLYLIPFYSIAVLLGMTAEDKANLQTMTDAIPGTDSYVSFMAPYLGLSYDRESDKTKWKYFAKASAIEDKAEREEYTNNYVRRWWYGANKWQAWWGTHKDAPWVYYGYWEFDIAAVVNAWGLDDSSFEDFKYYPKDMAHYLRG